MALFILIFEIIGTLAFAISGAVTGLKKNMDIFGVCILVLTTAVGGGIIRDVDDPWINCDYFVSAYMEEYGGYLGDASGEVVRT